MGKPRKFKTVAEMEEIWRAYKEHCDNRMVLTHTFSSKRDATVSEQLRHATTYTIEGFCVFAGMGRARFYETYARDRRFADLVIRMREECEVDARTKFELGMIPTGLAGMWMARHGYTTKTDADIREAAEVKIVDDLTGEGRE